MRDLQRQGCRKVERAGDVRSLSFGGRPSFAWHAHEQQVWEQERTTFREV